MKPPYALEGTSLPGKNKAIMQTGWGMGRTFITGRDHNKPFIEGWENCNCALTLRGKRRTSKMYYGFALLYCSSPPSNALSAALRPQGPSDECLYPDLSQGLDEKRTGSNDTWVLPHQQPEHSRVPQWHVTGHRVVRNVAFSKQTGINLLPARKTERYKSISSSRINRHTTINSPTVAFL